MAPAHGTVNWLQVDTDDPAGAQRFYGELFNWTFPSAPDVESPYRLATLAGTDQVLGGIADTRGESPNHAMFMVVVDDVPAAIAHAERLGGKVEAPAITTPDGLTFAKLRDPSGSTFGVYSPPAG
jgi:predicted enzyme related to lactoylglutathione lyase